MDVCFGEHDLERRLLLKHIFNGDWRRTDKIEITIPSVFVADPKGAREWKDQRLQDIANAGAWALLPNNFPIYNRGDWDGAFEALSSQCLLNGFCGIFRPVLRKFLDTFIKPRKSASGPGRIANGTARVAIELTVSPVGRSVPAVTGVEGDGDDGLLSEDVGGAGGLQGSVPVQPFINGSTRGEPSGPKEPVGGTEEREAKEKEGTTAADNERHRKLATEYVRTEAGLGPDRIAWMTMVCKPLQKALHRVHEVNGENHEVKTSAAAVYGVPRCSSETLGTPLCVAATGAIEKQFVQEMHAILDQDPACAYLRPDLHTEIVQTDIFNASMRSLCLTNKLVSRYHQQEPIAFYEGLGTHMTMTESGECFFFC